MAKVDTILEEIKGLTLLEASELVKKMEETFGVSAADSEIRAPRCRASTSSRAMPSSRSSDMSIFLPVHRLWPAAGASSGYRMSRP